MNTEQVPQEIPEEIYAMAVKRYPVHVMHEEGSDGYKVTMRDRIVYSYGVMDERAAYQVPLTKDDVRDMANTFAKSGEINPDDPIQSVIADSYVAGYESAELKIEVMREWLSGSVKKLVDAKDFENIKGCAGIQLSLNKFNEIFPPAIPNIEVLGDSIS